MTKLSKPIIFFGTDEFSLESLRALVDGGFSVRAVITKPDSRVGRGHKLTPPPVKTFAENHGITVWQPAKLSDIADEIQAIHEPVGILVSYGKIIPESIISLFSPGIINVHPSLLPKYRGPSPIETAILNGDEKTGITIMKLSAEMDAGLIYEQAEYAMSGHETAPQLYKDLAKLGARLLTDNLPAIIGGDLTPTDQDEAAASYCQLLSKADASVDPTSLTANQLERRIRAYLSFPKTKLELCGHEVTVLKAHASSQQENPLAVDCQEGFLIIDQLIAPSGRVMSATDFKNGYCSS